MFLGRVVRIRRRVVAPEQTLFRPAIVLRRYDLHHGALSSVDVLVSRAVPRQRREEVAEDVIRAIATQVVGNDVGTFRVRWEGEHVVPPADEAARR